MEADIGGGKTHRVLLAPALQLSDGELNQVRHHAVLAHGLAVQAIRGRGASDIKVGFAENMEVAVPTVDTAAHVKAAEACTRETNAPFATVMLEGIYTDTYLERPGPTRHDSPMRNSGPSQRHSTSSGSTSIGRWRTWSRPMTRRGTTPSRSTPPIRR